jgi:hypothetical protein
LAKDLTAKTPIFSGVFSLLGVCQIGAVCNRSFWIVLLTAISESLPKARQVKAQNVILGLVTELVYLRVPKAQYYTP